ncbi:MAG: DsbA family protein [Chloroflexota bacterium]|jgi:protein-disulfide isomerase
MSSNPKKGKNLRPQIAVVVLIGGLLLLVWLLPRPNYPEVTEQRLLDDPYLGNPDAPIVLIEYGDYACEVCRLWHRAQVRQGLLARYPDQVRFVWRDNARRSTASIKAAEAGQCAHNQGRFWEYHDLLFEQEEGLGVEALKGYAVRLGLDVEKFNRCLDEDHMRRKVEFDMRRAGENGFSVTPAFWLNGEKIIGPPALDYLSEIIEGQLAKRQP